jgi:hypothetical protein
MKAIIVITAALLAFSAQAQTTRCYKNADGSITCTRGSGGF